MVFTYAKELSCIRKYFKNYEFTSITAIKSKKDRDHALISTSQCIYMAS